MVKETLQDRIMIGEFMGEDINEGGMRGWDWDDLEYHVSWDWLMPVIDKIEALDDVFVECKMEAGCVEIVCAGYEQTEGFFNNRLDATFNAVVGFIKWYNETNK